MFKKRIVGIWMLCMLLSFALIGCSLNDLKSSDEVEIDDVVDDTDEDDEDDFEKKVRSKKEKKDESDDKAVSEPKDSEPKVGESKVSKPEVSVPGFNTDATIEETVIIDQDSIKVTATGLTFTKSHVEVEMLIENNSDEDLVFLSGTSSYSSNAVNEYMVSSYMNVNVSAGKKAKEPITIRISDLQMYGINEIADIQIGIYTRDEDYNMTHYEPVKIETSLGASYDYAYDCYKETIESGLWESMTGCSLDYWNVEEYYNHEGITVESTGLISNEYGERLFRVECKNSSERSTKVAISDVSINGLVVSSGVLSGDPIYVGATSIIDIYIDNLLAEECFELLELDTITDIGFNVGLKNADINDYSDYSDYERIDIKLVNDAKEFVPKGEVLYDADDIKLTYVGMVESDSSFYGYYVLYVVENNSDEVINADCGYNSFSVDGFMVDFSCDYANVPINGKSLMKINLYKESVDSLGLTSIDDIDEVELMFRVRNQNYKDIFEEKLSH